MDLLLFHFQGLSWYVLIDFHYCHSSMRERDRVCICTFAQIELNNDICMSSGCWGTSIYLSLMVICFQWWLFHFQNAIPLPGRKNGKAEGQRRHASQVSSFKEFSRNFTQWLLLISYWPRLSHGCLICKGGKVGKCNF